MFHLLSVLKVVIFNVILGDLAVSIYYYNTGCFTWNAVKINFYNTDNNKNEGAHIRWTVPDVGIIYFNKFLALIKYLIVLL